MFQKTIKEELRFTGKGLHTGKAVTMTLKPAPPNTGIIFRRTDLGDDSYIPALATYVTNTSRSTSIENKQISISTIEHLMSSLYGMGVDNLYIDIDNVEVPIMDGSAKDYVRALAPCIEEQDEARSYLNIDKTIEIKDEQTGSYIKMEPAESPSYELTIDFNSRILGVQKASWDPSIDYASQIASCRTFVFYHELELLFSNNLIKGGDVDNAIVIVENPVTQEQLDNMAKLLNKSRIKVTDTGYLDNLVLRFPNEPARHKLLDLIGDLYLVGRRINARISAYKPGHKINTNLAKQIINQYCK